MTKIIQGVFDMTVRTLGTLNGAKRKTSGVSLMIGDDLHMMTVRDLT